MIYLLDLNYTLVANSDVKLKPFIEQIAQEEYRLELIEALKGQRVFLLTARPHKYKIQTLASILDKTGWQPEIAFFNEYRLPPPKAKERMLLDHVRKIAGRSPLEAIESNPKTRAMYQKHCIPAVTWEEFLSNEDT